MTQEFKFAEHAVEQADALIADCSECKYKGGGTMKNKIKAFIDANVYDGEAVRHASDKVVFLGEDLEELVNELYGDVIEENVERLKGLVKATEDELFDKKKECNELKHILRMVKDFHLRDLDEHVQKCIIDKLGEVEK